MAATGRNQCTAIEWGSFPLWMSAGFWGCMLIAVAVVVRRAVALLTESGTHAPQQLAALDAFFASHAGLTWTHILSALAFVSLFPFLFWARTANSKPLQRGFFAIGFITGITAYAMSVNPVGGWIELSAVLFFDSLFLACLVAEMVLLRRDETSRAQRWMLRAVAIVLGIATTRPVMGVFFATSRATHWTPHQFFGIAFWIGFSMNTVAMEFWLRRRRVYVGGEMMNNASVVPVHKGPHPGMLAVLYTVLFCVGLYPVTMLYKLPYWPGPWEQASTILSYFQGYGGRALFCIVLQFGAMVCLGLFTATVVSRLHFLGARAAGTYIVLFGGFLVVADSFAGTMAMWAMMKPPVIGNSAAAMALYYLGFGLGGPGFSVPMGLLMAGVSVTAAFMKLLPKWVIVLGLVLAVAGELSSLTLAFPRLLFLIPLVRFPGFIWLIAVGFMLPKSRRPSAA